MHTTPDTSPAVRALQCFLACARLAMQHLRAAERSLAAPVPAPPPETLRLYGKETLFRLECGSAREANDDLRYDVTGTLTSLRYFVSVIGTKADGRAAHRLIAPLRRRGPAMLPYAGPHNLGAAHIAYIAARADRHWPVFEACYWIGAAMRCLERREEMLGDAMPPAEAAADYVLFSVTALLHGQICIHGHTAGRAEAFIGKYIDGPADEQEDGVAEPIFAAAVGS